MYRMLTYADVYIAIQRMYPPSSRNAMKMLRKECSLSLIYTYVGSLYIYMRCVAKATRNDHLSAKPYLLRCTHQVYLSIYIYVKYTHTHTHIHTHTCIYTWPQEIESRLIRVSYVSIRHLEYLMSAPEQIWCNVEPFAVDCVPPRDVVFSTNSYR